MSTVAEHPIQNKSTTLHSLVIPFMMETKGVVMVAMK